MILVSVIIPYFKKKNYIKSSIKSVLNQSLKNFEIIVVYDDFLKDDLNLLREIARTDPRIKIIVNKKNIGAGPSRNKAIKYSRGKYIAFLDADDLWHKEKLKIQIDFMKKNNYEMTHTSYTTIDSEGKKLSNRIAKVISYNDLLKSCDIGLSTVIVKKKLLKKKYFGNTKTKEDYVLWLDLTKKKNFFFSINKKLTFWRNVDDSLSSSTMQKLFDGYKVYRKHLKLSVTKSLISLIVLSYNFLKK